MPTKQTAEEHRLLLLIRRYRTGCFEEDLDKILEIAERLAKRPYVNRARRSSGLAAFERTNRRVVYLDGDPTPRCAWRVPGEPEHDEWLARHQRYEEALRQMNVDA